jgi:hypothetical protein
MNIYKRILSDNIIKLFNLFNLDPFSESYGYGDREYWGWKIKDFANGTMQGAVHSITIAIKLNLIENEKFALNLVDSAITAIPKIMEKNGSLAEAYPRENSFCVTALVAFDVLSAIDHLDTRLDEKKRLEYLEIVHPLINFISHYDEVHAVISNHIATAVAALTLWTKLTGNSSNRAQCLLNIIYENQSEEGWYKEYEGADPGYQTLCTYYLSSVHEITKDEKLKMSLEKSAAFLKYFVHPDGSIGGLYGSRNTEVFYPGGISKLNTIIQDFASIESFFCKKIPENNCLLPQNADTGNYIPLLNSFAYAALATETTKEYGMTPGRESLPFSENFEKVFMDAGIFIKSTDRYYAIINYKKGGTIKVFNKTTNQLDMEDGGICGFLVNGKKFSSQAYNDKAEFNTGKLKVSFYKINESASGPFQFLILRSLSLTLFRSVMLGNIFKKQIVKMLMTGKRRVDGFSEREFLFLEDRIIIKEKTVAPTNTKFSGHVGKFKSIHMASSGYYLKQHENLNHNSSLVRIDEA